MVNENIGIAGGLLHSYFVDGAILNDSCTLFVPDGVSPSEYRQSDAYQQASKNQQEYGGSLSLVADSLQYAYMKAQVESIICRLRNGWMASHIGKENWNRPFIRP